MVEKIACFLTCGYTESGAMQAFLKKMNETYDFRQFLPNKTIKKKGDPKRINPELQGLTGERLLKRVYDTCKKRRDELADYKAILIEDDLDGRFSKYTEKEVKLFNQAIVDRVHEELGTNEIPVILLYASPEIESWFVADWKNSFQYVYCDANIVTDINKKTVRQFFVHHLKNYIENRILQEYADQIEDYGWFEGEYRKLSDQIIDAYQETKVGLNFISGANADFVEQILASKELYYSKSRHGVMMLRKIEPANVAEKCRKYFSSSYEKIRVM